MSSWGRARCRRLFCSPPPAPTMEMSQTRWGVCLHLSSGRRDTLPGGHASPHLFGSVSVLETQFLRPGLLARACSVSGVVAPCWSCPDPASPFPDTVLCGAHKGKLLASLDSHCDRLLSGLLAPGVERSLCHHPWVSWFLIESGDTSGCWSAWATEV